MSQQALDLRRSIKIVWRHKILMTTAVVLGIIAGAAYAHFYPPTLTSTALVVLPQPPQNLQATGSGGGADPFTATQEVIAGSNQVLEAALSDLHPAMSLPELRHDVQIGSLTPLVISVTAKGTSAADAEARANAVAKSYVRYVNSSTNPAEHVTADLLESATAAVGSAPLKQLIVDALLGAVVGFLIGAIIALAIGRNDRRLRERDEIADSIGVPVLASFPVVHPADAAGWTKLLEDYKPGVRSVLQLRKALQHLGMAAASANNGNSSEPNWSSVTIVSLSSDSGALALGPQLAAFAASQGIPTALVLGPPQNPDAAATLRTACAVPPPASSNRPGLLRVTVSDHHVEPQPDAVLTVVVVVVDGVSPRMPDTMHTTATLLGVSAGVATAEQLARVAVSAYADGHEITGILVADPEPTDRTTGRIPQLPRPMQRRLPTRTTDTITEIRR
jgi:capsular polysaccharide biosynthesis protein